MTRTLVGVLARAMLVTLVFGYALTQAGTDTYVYDGAGRLKQVLRSGTVTTYSLDWAGNRTSVSIAYTAAPNPPTNLAGNVISATRIDLTWTAATDNGIAGLAGYRIYRDGVTINTSPAASYSDTTVVGSTTYIYKVSSYDNSNKSFPADRSCWVQGRPRSLHLCLQRPHEQGRSDRANGRRR